VPRGATPRRGRRAGAAGPAPGAGAPSPTPDPVRPLRPSDHPPAAAHPRSACASGRGPRARAAAVRLRASGLGRAGVDAGGAETNRNPHPQPKRLRAESAGKCAKRQTKAEKAAPGRFPPWTPGDYWTEEYNIHNNILSPQRGQVQRAATPSPTSRQGQLWAAHIAAPRPTATRAGRGGKRHAAGEAVRVEHGPPRRSTRILNKLTCAQQRSTVGRCTPLHARTSLLASWITSDHTIDGSPRAHHGAYFDPTERRNHQLICPTPQWPHTHLHHHLMPACLFDRHPMHQPLVGCMCLPPPVHPMRHLTKRMLRNTAPRRGVSCPDGCIISACPGSRAE
jgi:hypothetical protein